MTSSRQRAGHARGPSRPARLRRGHRARVDLRRTATKPRRPPAQRATWPPSWPPASRRPPRATGTASGSCSTRRWPTAGPPILDSLRAELLRRDPARRPDGAEIARASRRTTAPAVAPPGPRRVAGHGRGVRRPRPRSRRCARVRGRRRGASITVRVPAAPGMGKSALVHHFLDELGEPRARALVLRGRAYERESVPYKAIDSVVDALSRHLMRLERNGDPAACPADSAGARAPLSGAPARAGAPRSGRALDRRAAAGPAARLRALRAAPAVAGEAPAARALHRRRPVGRRRQRDPAGRADAPARAAVDPARRRVPRRGGEASPSWRDRGALAGGRRSAKRAGRTSRPERRWGSRSPCWPRPTRTGREPCPRVGREPGAPRRARPLRAAAPRGRRSRSSSS